MRAGAEGGGEGGAPQTGGGTRSPAAPSRPRAPAHASRRLALGLWVLAGLMLAGVVHLAAVLLVPRLARADAYHRLAALAPLHAVALLPRGGALPGGAAGRAALPFADPSTALAACRYDLAAGPVRLRAEVGDALFGAALLAPGLGVHAALTGRAASAGVVEAVIGTPAQVAALEAADDEDEPARELRLRAPAREGIVLLRALAPTPGALPALEATLARAACGPG